MNAGEVKACKSEQWTERPVKGRRMVFAGYLAVLALSGAQAFSQAGTSAGVQSTAALTAGVSPAGATLHVPTGLPVSPAPVKPASVAPAYGKLPLTFAANRGQVDSSVKFVASGQGYNLYLTGNEAVLKLNKAAAGVFPGAAIPGRRAGRRAPKREKEAESSQRTDEGGGDVIRMDMLGANRGAPISGVDALPGTTNYFLGKDPARWHTHVPTFAKVRYSGVYPGVDLIYYGNQRRLEYDFIVAPHADPKQVALRFSGAQQLRLDEGGNLLIQASNGGVALKRPVVYQEKQGRRVGVKGQYTLGGDGTVRFKIGRYDHGRALVIDPTLTYSSYLGGSSGDSGTAIAVDANGGIYVTGYTVDTDFPVTTGAYQTVNATANNEIAFVAKLTAAGTPAYVTYLGGTGDAEAFGIAVDAAGDAYIAGEVNSASFPTTPGAFQTVNNASTNTANNAFITKLSPDGTVLIYSTFLGGSGLTISADFVEGDSPLRIAVDGNQNAYVVGTAYSTDFPVTPTAFQRVNNAAGNLASNAFVTKLSVDGKTLVYSTYLGGSGVSPDTVSNGDGEGGGESGYGIAVDAAGEAYVSGAAYSGDFPLTANGYQPANHGTANAAFNGFVARLNAAGTGLLNATYLGGTGLVTNQDGSTNAGEDIGDESYGLALDGGGNVYAVGAATSTDFPVTAGVVQPTNKGAANLATNGFVSKLDPTLATLLYSTYLGGSGVASTDGGSGSGDIAIGIAVDGAGNAYLTGFAESPDFPVSADAFQAAPRNAAAIDSAFFSVVSPTGGALTYSTYFGGSGASFYGGLLFEGDLGYDIALDAAGNSYLVGSTYSYDFPVTKDAQQRINNAGGGPASNTFIAKFGALAGATYLPTKLTLTSNAPTAPSGGAVTYTAVVTGVAGVPIPTGNVTFYLNSVKAGTAALDATGTATFTTNVVSGDSLLVDVIGYYTGDATYGGSGLSLGQAVATPTLLAFTAAPAATIAPGGNGGTATVQVEGDNGLLITSPAFTVTVTITGPAGYTPQTLTGVTTNGVAVFNFANYPLTLPGGYSYEATANGLAPAVALETVTGTAANATTTTLALSAATVPANTVVTLTAAVTATATGGAVTPGLVEFCDATAARCVDSALLGTAALTAAGTATLQILPAIGSHSYVAVFPGTAAVLGSSSTVQALTVTGQYPTTTTIAATGTVGNYTLTASVVGQGTQTVTPTGTVSFFDVTGDTTLGTATLGAGVAGLSFVDQQNPYTVGPGGNSVVTGDFNGDGILDLAVASSGGNTRLLTILAGDGRGGFAATVASAELPQLTALAVGDFNGDGIADLAVARHDDNVVEIDLGNGTGVTITAPVSTTATGAGPVSPVVADFNGDGRLDVAVANSGGNTVTVLLGNGDGTMTAAAGNPAPTGINPVAMTTADFNGDGRADLAVVNNSDNTVTILLSNGDGSFTPVAGVPPATGAAPEAIVAGDFNGDGKADLAIANNADSSVSVLLGNGDGSFTPAPGDPSFSAAGPASIVTGDFNGDGRLDIATANNRSSTIVVLLGNADGTFSAGAFTPPATGANPVALISADFNGDGAPDLVTANNGTNLITVLLTERTQTATAVLNNVSVVGAGTHQVDASYGADANFSASTSTTTGIEGTGGIPQATTLTLSATPAAGSFFNQPITLTATLAPFNGNGVTTDGETISFFANGGDPIGTGTLLNGVATFRTQALQAGVNQLTANYAGDANFQASTAAQLLYTVSPVAGTTTTLTASAAAAVVAGTPVTLFATVTASGVPVSPGTVQFCDAGFTLCEDSGLLGTAQLTAQGTANYRFVPGIGTHSYYARFVGTSGASLSSSLAQGPVMVVVAGTYPTTTTIAAAGAPGNYTLTGTVAGVGSAAAAPGGALSFLDTSNGNASLGTAQLVAGTAGFSFLNSANLPTGNTPVATAAGDFNGDGRLDVAALNDNDGTVVILAGNGDGTFTTGTPITLAGGGDTLLVVADFNGDGRLDLVAGNLGGQIGLLLGNGDGTFTASTLVTGVGDARYVAVGDFNGDGRQDIAAAGASDSGVAILLGNGDGTFTAAAVADPLDGRGGIAVGDFNGDGKADLAVVSFTSNTISVLLGNGDGTFTAGANLPTGAQPNFIAVGDFNGDGKADLAVTNESDASANGTVTVLLGNGDGTFTAAAASSATNSEPIFVATGDFNRDGKTDLVVGNFAAATDHILLGNGDGTFTASAIPATFVLGAAVGDFNGDGFADIAGANGGGDVNIFLAQLAQTATATLANVSVSAVPATHNVGASYPGDTNFTASVSAATVALTGAAAAATTLTLNAAPVQSSFGQPVTITATLASDVPTDTATGTVTFLDGPTTLGTVAIAGGAATLTTNTLPVGENNLTASYSGDAKFAASNAQLFVVDVSPAAGGLTITSLAPNTAAAGRRDLTVTINGTGFVTGASVTVNGPGLTGAPQAATFVSATQLTTTITRAELATVGTLSVAVVNPDGTTSNTAIFNVIVQPVQVVPANLDFGSVTVGTQAAAQVVTVTNTQATVLTIDQVALQLGVDPADFAQTNNCPATLAAGASCQISVTFTPTGVGVKTAGLGVYDDSPPQPQVVTVSGTGTGGILQVNPGNLKTLAGTGVAGYTGDGGAATLAELNLPSGLNFDALGNLYFADQQNNVVRKIDTAGTITTIAGNGTAGFSGDGGPATSAQLAGPSGVVVDAAGNLYIEDPGNARIRKIDATGTITTFAGTGQFGFGGDGGPATAAQLSDVQGARFDGTGNLYVPQCTNPAIRKIDTKGIITTVAGTGVGGFAGDDGPATAALLQCPSGVAIDAAGNMYIADEFNERIRKVDAGGTITTIAGIGTAGFSGDGGAATGAQFNLPNDVDVDGAGNVYVADLGNNRLRKIDANGTITTAAGGLNNAGSAGVNTPLSVALDAAGNLYFADSGNNAVREVFPAGVLAFPATSVGVAATPLTVTLSNIGNLPIVIASQASFALGGDAADFSLAGGTCLQGATLAGGDSCSLQIGFTPTVAGARNLTVTITDDAVFSPQSFGIGGSGVAGPPPGTGVVLNTITPAAAEAGSADTSIAVAGANFTTVSVVNFGGTPLATTYVSATQLTAVIPAAQLTTEGNVAVTVTDTISNSVSLPQTFTILPATAVVTFTGPPTSNPGEQPTLNFTLQQGYPVALNGTMTLTFTPDAGNPDSQQVQFATGGRTFNFTLPANTTDTPLVLVQAGTISGTITVSLTLTAGGINVTPPNVTPITIAVPKVAPTISSLSFTTSGNVLTVVVSGYSSTREIQSATFSFTPTQGASLSAKAITVPTTALFTTWYTNPDSTQFGSSFTYTQIFNLSGPATVVGGVGATLTNSIGSSAEVTAP